jgi:hypothetical protein
MKCVRCGKADVVARPVFIASDGGENLELTRAIKAALRAQGIEGEEWLGQLCEECFQVAEACIQEGGHVYATAHRELVLQRYEANLGRPLTPAERKEIEAYLRQPGG